MVNSEDKPTEIANPNGSIDNIAGICNERRNVAGLMPHPERASEGILGCAEGRMVFESLVNALRDGMKSSKIQAPSSSPESLRGPETSNSNIQEEPEAVA